MKYILVNPEELVSEIEQNDGFGKDGFMPRITFGKAEPEWDFAGIFIRAARSKAEGKTEEADLTSIFEYQNYGITPEMARAQLKKLVDIERFDNNKDGEEIVYIRYMSAKEMREKKEDEREDAIIRWSELEDKIKQLAPKKYSPEEISQIVKFVLNRYTQDLQSRDDIIFEHESYEGWLQNREPKIGDTIHIGGGTQYYPEDKVYSVNGENIIVSACIKGSDEPAVAPDYRMTNEGGMVVDILRKGQDGQYENFARCIKSVSKKYGASVSCYMGDLYYSTSDTKSEFHPTPYTFGPSRGGTLQDLDSEITFRKSIKQMVQPDDITKLYEAFLSKIRFQFPDKSRQQQKPPMKWGMREVGDWPEKRPTNLNFEEIMSYGEIATRMQRVPQDEITKTDPQKDNIQTI